jgi:hypothetical protein
MPGHRQRKRHAAAARHARPLLLDRIRRNPIVALFGGAMVNSARWRRDSLGEESVAPTPEDFAGDPPGDRDG